MLGHKPVATRLWLNRENARNHIQQVCRKSGTYSEGEGMACACKRGEGVPG